MGYIKRDDQPVIVPEKHIHIYYIRYIMYLTQNGYLSQSLIIDNFSHEIQEQISRTLE